MLCDGKVSYYVTHVMTTKHGGVEPLVTKHNVPYKKLRMFAKDETGGTDVIYYNVYDNNKEVLISIAKSIGKKEFIESAEKFQLNEDSLIGYGGHCLAVKKSNEGYKDSITVECWLVKEETSVIKEPVTAESAPVEDEEEDGIPF